MKAVLSASRDVIAGDYQVRIALSKAVPFGDEDVVVSDSSPFTMRRVYGSDRNYYYQFCLAEGVSGEFTVSLSSRFQAVPVVVRYDTIRSVEVSFGAVRQEGSCVILPVQTSERVVGLTKRHFRAVGFQGQCYLSGKDREYLLKFVPKASVSTFSVEVVRPVMKANGVLAEVFASQMLVEA